MPLQYWYIEIFLHLELPPASWSECLEQKFKSEWQKDGEWLPKMRVSGDSLKHKSILLPGITKNILKLIN